MDTREMWYVYIVKCTDGSLYTGTSIWPERRLEEHKSKGSKSAKYMRAHTPHSLVYQKAIGSRSDALKEEYRIKQLSKANKQKLINQD